VDRPIRHEDLFASAGRYGYLHPSYAESFVEAGEVRHLRRSRLHGRLDRGCAAVVPGGHEQAPVGLDAGSPTSLKPQSGLAH
jgi:hypothetical protein